MARRQGQRSGALRSDLSGPEPVGQDHRAVAGVGVSVPPGADGVRAAIRHPRDRDEGQAFSTDRNLFHISYEGGILEDPWEEAPEEIFQMTVSPEKAPAKPAYVEIDYEEGNPVAVNGKRLSPAALLAHLNGLGGAHGSAAWTSWRTATSA